jgi:flagellar protein FlaG
MDVNRIGTGYTPAPAQSPMPGSGEFAPAPPPEFVPSGNTGGEIREVRAESSDALRRAVDEINTSVSLHRRHLDIRHHEPTNRRIVTVYNSDTNEIVREIPPERVLQAHANMLEMVGLFMDTRG